MCSRINNQKIAMVLLWSKLISNIAKSCQLFYISSFYLPNGVLVVEDVVVVVVAVVVVVTVVVAVIVVVAVVAVAVISMGVDVIILVQFVNSVYPDLQIMHFWKYQVCQENFHTIYDF